MNVGGKKRSHDGQGGSETKRKKTTFTLRPIAQWDLTGTALKEMGVLYEYLRMTTVTQKLCQFNAMHYHELSDEGWEMIANMLQDKYKEPLPPLPNDTMYVPGTWIKKDDFDEEFFKQYT